MSEPTSGPVELQGADLAPRRRRRRHQRNSTVGYAAGVSLLVAAVALAVSAAVTARDEFREVWPLLGAAAGCAAVGGLAVYVYRVPSRLRTPNAFAAVATIFLTLVAVSTVTYRLTGTFSRWDDALFESVAGFTTTAMSVLEQPEATARGVVFWRATTQLMGGFFSLVVVVALLPFLGVGGLEVSEIDRPSRSAGLLTPRARANVRRLAVTYVGLTGAGIALFLAGGMGPFDAVTYAFTTISTGGFQNHAGSFAYFDSAVIEWLAVGGMVLAGMNIALLARTLRGQLGPIQRSAELRVYAGVLVGGTLLGYWWASPEIGTGWTPLRHVAFSVTSVVSTTGASVTDWGGWPMGPQVLLLLLMGVGAMSGSTGGGFRIIRAMALIGYVRRELVRQLHPQSVVVVKVGRAGLSEDLVSRLIGYQVLFVTVAGFGAVAIALFDVDLVTSVSASISAMSNVGTGLGELTPGGGALSLSTGARGVLVPVMILGRLEISPILAGLAALTARSRRLRSAAWSPRR